MALIVEGLRRTCRCRAHNDPRPDLRHQGQSYIYATLHAHQLHHILFGEAGTGAMVSRSLDGELIVPMLRWRGCVPIRGSSRSALGDKGGLAALDALKQHVLNGKPAFLAVDGPRGPRNRVHKGVCSLSRETQTPVIGVIAVPTRRWIIPRSWDRMQIPQPFSTIEIYFTDPLRVAVDESIEEFRKRVEGELCRLEREHDPREADRAPQRLRESSRLSRV
jgi:lysophospholipid acyltransferase (LPLAT)-like uncharacterized protein